MKIGYLNFGSLSVFGDTECTELYTEDTEFENIKSSVFSVYNSLHFVF